MTIAMRWKGGSLCLTYLLLVTSSVLLIGCGAKPIEKALIGKWVSDNSSIVFHFLENNEFRIEDPGNTRQPLLSGKYHVVGNSTKLSNAEFVLEGGYDIKFNEEGDAFYIYIDYAGSPEELYRRTNQ